MSVRPRRRTAPGRGGMVGALVLCLTFLSGCGFTLRGEVSLPRALDRTYVLSASEEDELGAELRRRLRGYGVELVDRPEEASATLRVGAERRAREVLAVNEQGKALEYTLSLATNLEVLGKAGKVLLPNKTVSVSRDFIFDQNQVLGSVAEAEVAYAEMRKDLVRIIMYRLQAIH